MTRNDAEPAECWRAICAVSLLLALAGCGDSAPGSADTHPYGQFTTKGPSPEEKFAALARRAETGDAKSQLGLARMYYNGDGVARDYARAAAWYQKAAEQGDVLSQFKLGAMYEKGEGLPRDPDKAAAWWEKAAAQGNDAAREALASLQAAR